VRPLFEILVGDCRARLRDLPEASVQTVVTSPPYFGLRNYGAEGQIGLEPTPAEFVEALVGVFREVRRALRPDGTVWLNLGDSYCNSDKWGGSSGGKNGDSTNGGEGYRARRGGGPAGDVVDQHGHTRASRAERMRAVGGGAKPKDLLMIPARVALALRDDGWWLRKDIIWAKPNPMPESVEDRPTSAHEHVFLLARSEDYFFDAQAIAEPATGLEDADGFRGGAYCDGETFDNGGAGGRRKRSGNKVRVLAEDRGRPDGGGQHIGRSIPWEGSTRNARDVWTIATQPTGDQLCQRCGRFFGGREVQRLPKAKPPHRPDPVCRCGASDGWLAHYATMPVELARRCIAAGTSEVGGCGSCGAPWVRVVERKRTRDGEALAGSFNDPAQGHRIGATGVGHWRDQTAVATTGWRPSCSCADPAPVAQRVLDPFGGAGTTALAARRLQRAVTLVELHPGYAELARHRVAADAPLLQGVA
jgi:DNA modification methylase